MSQGAPGATGPTGSIGEVFTAGATGATAIMPTALRDVGRSLPDGLHAHAHFEMAAPVANYPVFGGQTFAIAGPLDLLTIAAVLVVAGMIAAGKLSIQHLHLTPAAK